MSFDIDVRMDVKNLTNWLDRLERQAIPRATTAAINKTATNAKATAAKTLSKEMGLTQKVVRKYVDIRKAYRGTEFAVLTFRRAKSNLIRFGARQTKRGVSAKAWGKRKIYKHTFIGNQGRTVFKRVGKSRLPIKPVYGASIPTEAAKDKTRQAVQQTVNERFPRHFRDALRRFSK